MAITNQPIRTHRSMGNGAALFGVVSHTLMPGLALGFALWMVVQWIVMDHRKSAPFGAGVVFTYWLFVGNRQEKAWRNLSRFVPSPVTYVGTNENASIISLNLPRSDSETISTR